MNDSKLFEQLLLLYYNLFVADRDLCESLGCDETVFTFELERLEYIIFTQFGINEEQAPLASDVLYNHCIKLRNGEKSVLQNSDGTMLDYFNLFAKGL